MSWCSSDGALAGVEPCPPDCSGCKFIGLRKCVTITLIMPTLSITGDLVYEYDDLGYTNAVSDVHFHPHENMIVFCSFGVGHPVHVYLFDIEGR